MIKRANGNRKAFSLVELVFVIVILGIVGMIGSDIIAKMYQGYLKSQITNTLQQKTELLLDQISSRLKYRIKDTVIGRNSSNNKYMKLNDDNITSIGPDMIEWIGYDYDSYLGENNGSYSVPGWSGFVDVNNTNTGHTQLYTLGSELNVTKDVIFTLSYTQINIYDGFSAGKQHPILFSKCYHDSNMSIYGWDIPHTLATSSFDNNATFKVKAVAGTNNTLYIANRGERDICEQYYLAWSAYAIVPSKASSSGDFNLTLRYNYQPWEGEDYNMTTNGTKSALLAEHVTTFRAMQVGNSIRIKVCITDGNITGTPYGFCKEKAVF